MLLTFQMVAISKAHFVNRVDRKFSLLRFSPTLIQNFDGRCLPTDGRQRQVKRKLV